MSTLKSDYRKKIQEIPKFKFKWDKRRKKLDHIQEQAQMCIDFYELKYKFVFDNAKQRAGQCDYGRKRISLSRHYCELNDYDEIQSTIIHEVAHALSGKMFREYGHGKTWQFMDIHLGNNGHRCYDSKKVNMPEGKYKYVCLRCDFEHNFHRKPKRQHACPKCCKEHNNGVFTKKFLLCREEIVDGQIKYTKQ
jgi:predicted SprT family Zn-dependent metalloprotease